MEDAESEDIQNSAPDKFKQVTEWMNGRQRWRAWTEITEYSRSFRVTNTQTMLHETNSKMEYNTSIFLKYNDWKTKQRKKSWTSEALDQISKKWSLHVW